MRYEKPETALKPLLVREGAVALVRRGLPFATLDGVAAAAGVGRLALARVIDLSSTTLARRRKAGVLTPEESDRLLRVARLVALAHDLMLGDGDAARRWLGAPHALLEGESPLERASTEVGGREVEQLIGRLRHGVFSQRVPKLVHGWRLASPRLARDVEDMLSGEGALRFGGRWNSPGRRAVYLGGSLALASLELLVHLEADDVLKSYRKLRVAIPEDLIEVVDSRELPADWARTGLHPVTQKIGDQWLDALEAAVLRVPSAVVIGEVNYLVNPGHPDFCRLEPDEIRGYRYDPRLVKTSGSR